MIEQDLGSLGDVHNLLRGLNDAYAGGAKIADLVAKIPVLSARCLARARKRYPAKVNASLAEALTLIGNMGLEAELLQLLEDLTILSADVGSARAPAPRAESKPKP